MPLDIVILAAGQGTRMHSAKPKVLHTIAGKPMLQHVIDASRAFDDAALHVVIGHGAEQVKATITDTDIHWVLQEKQLGTGHAVAQALPFLREQATVLILYGDVPLVNPATLKQLVLSVEADSMALLTVELENPTGYGRIIRDVENKVARIVEQKDAGDEYLRIREVNTGIMAANSAHLARWLPSLDNSNAQKEFYLTDIIAMARTDGVRINTQSALGEAEVLGVNDRHQQARLERIYQDRQARALMAQGVTLMDPQRFDCRGQITVGRDVMIDVNVVFEGDVVLGDGVVIEPNCVIRNARIGSHSRIKASSVIEGAVVIGEHVDVGPFARLRPGTVLHNGARIGNFVETKNAIFGEHSKANHLAYIGDAEIGSDSNIGAGTITCNYDGVNKFRTTLGDNVFIGSNSTLVAPLVVESGGFVGAGSTITKTVPANNLAVGRGQQRNIDGWQRPRKKPQ
ncbi:MAG TPA: bifunctional UDP-N-acetylglucosamine diphosphorylase/glucosamine-1-phosphate N-acetyltransferase GlmU [Pseudomonadales bacterium]|nr:bifunctional UDP-N-acetylglucosamine diphosphorylase/glucosamine-1-phosphate N-acetyltransferase GlmU [Pseudomonadales bacterium]